MEKGNKRGNNYTTGYNKIIILLKKGEKKWMKINNDAAERLGNLDVERERAWGITLLLRIDRDDGKSPDL
jgi:hypothetical protein